MDRLPVSEYVLLFFSRTLGFSFIFVKSKKFLKENDPNTFTDEEADKYSYYVTSITKQGLESCLQTLFILKNSQLKKNAKGHSFLI
ncbi:hypothetical protein DMO16_10365 [Fictibacillus sp. S7]|nr:hypothetical protein DMO16_10365 [Fictibacillus sp. S7]